jgi:CheY-like chemotaxis protein
MDVQMPEMNGLDATMEIRKTDFGKTIPIIAVTAGTMKEEIDRCLASGMNDFMSKPALKETFRSIFLKWLGSEIQ